MRWSLGLVLITGIALGPARPAIAAHNPEGCILVHLATPTGKAPCTSAAARPPCSAIVTQGALYPRTYYAYVLAGRGASASGFSALEFGVNYNGAAHAGVDIFSWTLCADNEFSSTTWPAAGSGNTVFWNAAHCQRSEPGGVGTGVVATAGYFYCAAYSNDRLAIEPNSLSHTAAVVDCGAVRDVIYFPGECDPTRRLGYADFGTGFGWNPCLYNGPVDCGTIGPSTVAAGSTNVIYGADEYSYRCLNVFWFIEGNATITGYPDPWHVSVNVGGPGEFVLHNYCQIEVDASSHCCTRVQVAGVAAVPEDRPGAAPEAVTALPNPMRGAATLRFALRARGEARLVVYDVRGSVVAEIDLGVLEAGPHDYTWDGRDTARRPVGSGIYFLRVSNGAQSLRGRLLVIR